MLFIRKDNTILQEVYFRAFKVLSENADIQCNSQKRKDSSKKVVKMFGQFPNSPYLCIRFPKGTAQQDEH
jgi:hypothetical protein